MRRILLWASPSACSWTGSASCRCFARSATFDSRSAFANAALTDRQFFTTTPDCAIALGGAPREPGRRRGPERRGDLAARGQFAGEPVVCVDGGGAAERRVAGSDGGGLVGLHRDHERRPGLVERLQDAVRLR